MIDQAIANGLYLELLIVAMTLLSILFFNNLVLYNQKVFDLISLMLISGIAMCALEIAWTVCLWRRLSCYVLRPHGRG